MDETKLLDVEQVAELLQCSTRHVHKMAADGRMPAPVHLGRSIRWNLEKLKRWIENGGSECLQSSRVQIVVEMLDTHRQGDIQARDTLLERLHDECGISLQFADELLTTEGGDPC